MNKIRKPLPNLVCVSVQFSSVRTHARRNDTDISDDDNNNNAAKRKQERNIFGENRGRTIKIKLKLLRSTF